MNWKSPQKCKSVPRRLSMIVYLGTVSHGKEGLGFKLEKNGPTFLSFNVMNNK